jgi:hypothetical protein
MQKYHVVVVAAIFAVLSAFFWFLSAQVQFPKQRGTLSDLDPEMARQFAAALRAQANRNKWASAFAATSAVLIAIAEFFFQA